MNQLVLEDIHRNAKAAKLATQKYKDMLIAAKTEKKKQETDKCKRELKTVEKRIVELDKILNKLYEDLALEKVTEERYQVMSKGYEEEQSGLKEWRNHLTELIPAPNLHMKTSINSCRLYRSILISTNSIRTSSMS